MRAAAALGDKQPSVIHFFLGRHDRVVMHGHFRCPDCSRLSSTRPIQTGTVVVIRFDALTHRETDFGIGNFLDPTRRSISAGRREPASDGAAPASSTLIPRAGQGYLGCRRILVSLPPEVRGRSYGRACSRSSAE